MILVALVLLRHQPWIDLPTLGIVDRRHPPRVARLGNEIRESHARCAGVEAGTTFRRPMNLLLAVDVPPISHVTIWGAGPLGFNKTAAIYVFATIATILVVLLRHAPQGRARAVGHPAEHRGVRRRLRPQPDHHADDGHRRPALPAVPHRAVLLHLLQQHHRDHPGRAVPRERTLRRCRSRSRCSPGSSTTSSAS